jgi:cyclic pyranopterin phosphate synthase
MLRYAKNQGIPIIGLVTNGQLLNPEMIEDIVDAGIDRVNVSLDTLDRVKYEKTRKGAKLDKIINNLDYLVDYRNTV